MVDTKRWTIAQLMKRLAQLPPEATIAFAAMNEYSEYEYPFFGITVPALSLPGEERPPDYVISIDNDREGIAAMILHDGDVDIEDETFVNADKLGLDESPDFEEDQDGGFQRDDFRKHYGGSAYGYHD